MLQLVNLSNYRTDVTLIRHSAECLRDFLDQHQLDGIEMMLCAPWEAAVHRPEWIHGVHLRFWPNWLDFWRGDREELLRQFGSEEQIQACYGGLGRDAWLKGYRENIRAAVQAGAKYLVFHVSNVRPAELFNWQFSASSREVVAATIEVINELADAIPAETALLFENLWWPGLTLQDKELTALLLENVKHPNVGLMLDTGHLMNTNHKLKTETEGIDYILATLYQLGEYRRYVRGIHLHRSLSGEYIAGSQATTRTDHTLTEIMSHVLKIDEHLPFSVPEVQRIVEYVKPDYLVHEFMQTSLADWGQKITQQQQALGVRRTNP